MSSTVSIATRGRTWLSALIVVLSALALAPAAAEALSVAVAMPDTVTVGQTGLTAHVELVNTSSLPATICDAGGCSGPSEGIVVIPSCASAGAAPTCTTPDPGVFSVAATATPALGSQCGETPLPVAFDVVVADGAQGKLRLQPRNGAVVTLAPAGPAAATCDIVLTLDVAKLPATDADPSLAGLQTRQSASAQARLGGAGGAGAEETGVGRDVTTVVPAATAPPPPPPPSAPDDLDHFKCYEALQSRFRQRAVGLLDRLGPRRSRVVRTRQLCNPVSKNGGGVLAPRAHLTCYETRDRNRTFNPRTVLVTNQFGQRKLTVLRPSRLCVPSLKRRTAGRMPSTPDPTRLLDHFRCYDVKPQATPRVVKLVDQFKTSESKVLEVVRLCNPVRKNNEPVRRPKSHLVCYSIRDVQAFQPLGVRVRNQFGLAALRVRRPQTLCLPSFAEVAPNAPEGLDHFKCYDAEQPGFVPRTVGLSDQFGSNQAGVDITELLCNPVRKNGGTILNKRAHLVCYATHDISGSTAKRHIVRVTNQFGVYQYPFILRSALCVPSLKRKGTVAPTGPDPAQVLDHFRCYQIKGDYPAAKTVMLVDQFVTTTTTVAKALRLCVSVSKNGEPVRRAAAHLVCYRILRPPVSQAVRVRNQFGLASLQVRRASSLCVPSLVQVIL